MGSGKLELSKNSIYTQRLRKCEAERKSSRVERALDGVWVEAGKGWLGWIILFKATNRSGRGRERRLSKRESLYRSGGAPRGEKGRRTGALSSKGELNRAKTRYEENKKSVARR